MSTTYSLAEMRLEVAENIGYDDGQGGVLQGKDITSAMIDKYLNRRYYRLLSRMANHYPEDFERTSTANFYKTLGTVDAVSGATLTTTGSVFETGMVGDTIYNETTGTSAVIKSYTSDTQVILYTENPEEWAAGDTIYVLGTEFAVGGDASDMRYPISVAVKYKDSDRKFRTCTPTSKNEVYKTGRETFPTSKPQWYKTNLKVNDVVTPAIGIVPEPTLPVMNGIQLRYVELPEKLSNDNDVPVLPLGSQHYLIPGATADALKKLQRGDEAMMYEREYMQGEAELISLYTRSRVQPAIGKESRINKLRNRDI